MAEIIKFKPKGTATLPQHEHTRSDPPDHVRPVEGHTAGGVAEVTPTADGEVLVAPMAPKEITFPDQIQAEAYMKALAEGKSPTAAAKAVHTTLPAVLNNPAIAAILGWAEIDAKMARKVVLGRLRSIVGQGDEKNAVSAAKVLIDADKDMGLSETQTHGPNVQIIGDDLKVLINNAPEIPGL